MLGLSACLISPCIFFYKRPCEVVNGRRHGAEVRMCDLIDLDSPDVRGALEAARLASPLIPAPGSVERGAEPATGRRESDGNNPFDRVLHETAEYVSKRGDPFEVMLQRALRPKDWRGAQSPARFTDDFTPRRKKAYLKTRNKTLDVLDESLLGNGFGLFAGDDRRAEAKAVSVDADVRGSNAAHDTFVVKREPKVAEPDALELSILNQSAMNDTLLEVLPKLSESDEAAPLPERGASLEEPAFPVNVTLLKPPNVQRSLSQGTGGSPTEPPCPNRRTQSVADGRRKASDDCSAASSFLDRGFLESKLSERSAFSSLSNVSSITRPTSASLSSVLSYDPINHAFLDSGSLRTSRERMSATESSVDTKRPGQCDLADLTERLDKVKRAMNYAADVSSAARTGSNSARGDDNDRSADDKLIDVDVFVPEQNKEFNRSSSSSTCSSDSVFANTSKVEKSILKEAKVLAKTFEELALKTDSGSSIDDFISNNTLWMSELLPAFEDEPVVNDLIELPVSPGGNSKDVGSNGEKESPASVGSTEENLWKILESSFTGVTAVKQDVPSLLSDLRKLIKTESNPEAKKLLDNLENMLDIKYKDNTELLATYLNASDESPSPRKEPSDSADKSIINKSEGGKESSREKLCKTGELPDVNYTSVDTSRDNVSSEKLSATSSSCKGDNEDRASTANSSEERDSLIDKKIAVELLINLQKLLSGQAEDDTTIQLLKNIGKALNVAVNNNVTTKTPASCTREQIARPTVPARASGSGCNAHSSELSVKVAHRRSLESKSKPFEKPVRRSVSAIEPPRGASNARIPRCRDAPKLTDRQKRFSSDPGFVSNLSNKKLAIPEARNARKAEGGPDSKKEKSIAMSDVKSLLKKRTDAVSKRGPMKAVHPVDNMQKKRASLGRQTQFSQITTPPKSNKATPLGNKLTSSTPISDSNYTREKSAKSKPIASSTPDGQKSKSAPLTSANKKRNLSCDISPVTTHVNTSGSDERKDSPKRLSKLPTPKKCTTPTRRQSDALGVPKFLTPPPRHHSSANTNNLRSPKRLNRSLINFQRYSPVSEKGNDGRTRQSPLRDTNRITAKVKPLNLISKIKRHSVGDFEKENSYV
ncbi:PREDICTED: uncharacterized protein LOC105560805 isoform X2 [Vollenhovia emeryi]|uniref:uncharacterized protein LOC105560805 isoform X2 n=1 Tax=Vollenhovia emeryi TaxID=411798 RepID=UPI0005F42721|nr:PREDICTED: uncharacterized protein LOC105560805 isoform X2 [Vollenhovia emeryi]